MSEEIIINSNIWHERHLHISFLMSFSDNNGIPVGNRNLQESSHDLSSIF